MPTVHPCPLPNPIFDDAVRLQRKRESEPKMVHICRQIPLLAKTGLCLWVAGSTSLGQVDFGSTFTRITSGPIATDEAYSRSCAWGDYDGDGYLDLIVGNQFGAPKALYHNEGDGSFTRVTTFDSSIDHASGCTWGDYDNDGDLDLFVANWDVPSHLYRNDGEEGFTRIINGAMGSNVAYSNGAAWGDYDDDGFLDLIVANSGSANRLNEFLYHNNGDGTFTSILNSPVTTSGMYSGVPSWADYDDDGRLDLLITHAGTLSDSRSLMFHNEGEGLFTRVSDLWTEVGEGGANWGDYDNDGDLDLSGTQWNQGTEVWLNLYRNDGNGRFTKIILEDFDPAVTNPRGGEWGDYDNDGWLDLYVATTHDVPQFDLLYRNNGDGTFSRILEGSLVNTADWSAPGAAWADYDNDGFLDLFLTKGVDLSGPQANALYHNDGNDNHWLIVQCEGAASNRSGIGAKVYVQAVIGGVARSLMRHITSGTGYHNSGQRAHFGLGDASQINLLRIKWPSGTVQELIDVAANQILTVKEPPALQVLEFDRTEGFKLGLKGGRGRDYLVEYSTNLVDWSDLTRFTTTNISTLIVDPTAASSPRRFYRGSEEN